MTETIRVLKTDIQPKFADAIYQAKRYFDYAPIIELAKEEASSATREALKTLRDSPRIKVQGFCFVTIDTEEELFVEYCKERGFGMWDKANGLMFSNPGRFVGKNNEIYKAGGEAFSRVLDLVDVKSTVHIRLIPK